MEIKYSTERIDKKRFDKLLISNIDTNKLRAKIEASGLECAKQLSDDAICAMKIYYLLTNSLSPEKIEFFRAIMEDHPKKEFGWYSSEDDDD